MDKKAFKKHYDDVYQFLGAFIEQCYVAKSDDEILQEYVSYEDVLRLLPQAREVLALDPFPEEVIEQATNQWSPNKSRKEWFAEIVAKLEARVKMEDK